MVPVVGWAATTRTQTAAVTPTAMAAMVTAAMRMAAMATAAMAEHTGPAPAIALMQMQWLLVAAVVLVVLWPLLQLQRQCQHLLQKRLHHWLLLVLVVVLQAVLMLRQFLRPLQMLLVPMLSSPLTPASSKLQKLLCSRLVCCSPFLECLCSHSRSLADAG